MKRILSLILALLLLCAALPAVSADEPTNPFTDVGEEDYFYIPVVWAVYNDITTGTSDTTFSPEAPCTRAQVVTFLWRTAASPKPQAMDNPFTDVAAGAYYYEAVLWAVENGITTGTSATTFSPDAPCTRAQVVTFLHRAFGSAPEKSENPFKDIAKGAYYYDAVLWAVERGITTGTSATTFGPNATCSRAQIVTFLYRSLYATGSLNIVSQPKFFYMTAYTQNAYFDIEISGGVAPYIYQISVHMDDEVRYGEYKVTENTRCTLGCGLTGKFFEEYKELYAYLTVQDSSGAMVTSKPIPLYPEFSVSGEPEYYSLTSDRETAEFTIDVKGGNGSYTYQWVVEYDEGKEFYAPPKSSKSRTDTFRHELLDSDFGPDHVIYVYCIITDVNGGEIRTDRIMVRPKLGIVKQPTDQQVMWFGDAARFEIEIRGGMPGFHYDWYAIIDGEPMKIEGGNTINSSYMCSQFFTEAELSKGNIPVYCVVTDSKGASVTSDTVYAIPIKP